MQGEDGGNPAVHQASSGKGSEKVAWNNTQFLQDLHSTCRGTTENTATITHRECQK